jgi:chromosome segregation ATPase
MPQNQGMLVIASLLMFTVIGLEAVKINNIDEDYTNGSEDFNGGILDLNGGKQNNIQKTNTYKRLDKLLDSLERNLHAQLKNVNNKINKDNNGKINFQKRLDNLKKSLIITRHHLKIAKSNFNRYNKIRNSKINDKESYLKSLSNQRKYMHVERKHLHLMMREANKFRKYPKQYNQIKNEIIDLKKCLNKQLRDISYAYNNLSKKINYDLNSVSKKRNNYKNKTHIHSRNYNRLVGKYKSYKSEYNKHLKKLHIKLKNNIKLRNQLKAELTLLDHLKNLLESFNPSKYNTYVQKYISCSSKLDNLNTQIRRANCTI